MRCLHFAGDEAPAGECQNAANHRGAAFGKDLAQCVKTLVAYIIQTAAQRGQVSVAFCRDCAEHGQHQPEVLHQHRGVINTLAQQRAQQDFQQGNDRHQQQCAGRQHFVKAPETAQSGS